MPLAKGRGNEGRGRTGECFCVFCLVFFSPLYLKYILESKGASKENLIDERTNELLLDDGVEFSLSVTV